MKNTYASWVDRLHHAAARRHGPRANRVGCHGYAHGNELELAVAARSRSIGLVKLWREHDVGVPRGIGRRHEGVFLPIEEDGDLTFIEELYLHSGDELRHKNRG